MTVAFGCCGAPQAQAGSEHHWAAGESHFILELLLQRGSVKQAKGTVRKLQALVRTIIPKTPALDNNIFL